MQKRFQVIVFTLCSIAAMAVISNANSDETKSSQDVYYQYGQVVGDGLNTADDSDIVVEANTFHISNDTIDDLAKEYMITGYDDYSKAYDNAIATLVSKYTVSNYAVENGYQVSCEYINGLIDEQRDGFKLASNYSDFEAFLSGLQMTEDEYWDSQRENLTIYETIANFKADYLAQARKKLMDTDSAGGDAAIKSYNDFVEQLISDENVIVH